MTQTYDRDEWVLWSHRRRCQGILLMDPCYTHTTSEEAWDAWYSEQVCYLDSEHVQTTQHGNTGKRAEVKGGDATGPFANGVVVSFKLQTAPTPSRCHYEDMGIGESAWPRFGCGSSTTRNGDT